MNIVLEKQESQEKAASDRGEGEESDASEASNKTPSEAKTEEMELRPRQQENVYMESDDSAAPEDISRDEASVSEYEEEKDNDADRTNEYDFEDEFCDLPGDI